MTAIAHQYEEPLFRSAHDALKFAFLFSSQQYPVTAMAKLMKGIVGSGKGLVGLDGAAQAGFICGMLTELQAQHRAVLTAKYARREDKRFIAAVNLLSMDPTIAPSGLSNRIERQALVGRHFGEKVSIIEVAELTGQHRNTVNKHHFVIRDRLRALEEAAYGAITDVFACRGVID